MTPSSLRQPAWHPTALLLILATWLATIGNFPLWTALWKLPETHGLKAIATLGILVLVILAATLTAIPAIPVVGLVLVLCVLPVLFGFVLPVIFMLRPLIGGWDELPWGMFVQWSRNSVWLLPSLR